MNWKIKWKNIKKCIDKSGAAKYNEDINKESLNKKGGETIEKITAQ